MFLKPDYSPASKLLLAYPENFQNEYEELVPFYDLLLPKLPHDIPLTIIVNNDATKRKLAFQLKRSNYTILIEKEWNEVWLRDVFGIPLNNNCILKSSYYPNYCSYLSRTRDFEKLNALSRKILENDLGQKIVDLPLTLDGGNFITNGRISILTDKVLKDNQGSQEKIEAIIKKLTGSRPIIVPGCPGDNVGHADGYMAFIDEKTIGLSKYPDQEAYKHDQTWLTDIESILRLEGLEVVPFQERPSSYYIPCKCEEMRRRKCCTMTANGVYVNYLRLNSTILLPEYSLPSLKETLYFNSVNEIELSKLGFQVIKINCDRIANQGGVLRCLTFVL